MFTTLLDPTILFFIFGILAASMGSTLEIPNQISKFLGLYLLMSLGLKGGYSLSQAGFTSEIVLVLVTGLLFSICFPIIGYYLLKKKLGSNGAAAVAATYGSVSAVTFVTATQYLEKMGIPFGGYMSAVLAVMEAPAIIVALMLAKSKTNANIKEVIGESFKDGAPALLLASMFIAYVGGEAAHKALAPFNFDLFKGMLSLFLLDMGLTAARSFKDLDKNFSIFAYGVLAPVSHAMIALLVCVMLHISLGNTILLMILASSASYIAVPAVLKTSLPDVNKALYIGMSLGITFPLNILIGIPLYSYIANSVL